MVKEVENTTENTPEHCHTCHLFSNCNQSQHMMEDTQPQTAYFMDASVLCKDCSNENGTEEPFPWVDTPLHCGTCGTPLDCRLTEDGIEYVKESLAFDGGGCCRELWPTLFEDEIKGN